MKAKVFDLKKFNRQGESMEFRLKMTMPEHSCSGVITIDTEKETVSVNLGSRITELERMTILKEVFFKFAFKKAYKVDYHVEMFKLVDVYDEEYDLEKAPMIIEELVDASSDYFSYNKSHDNLIMEIRASYNIIKNSVRRKGAEIELQDIYDHGGYEDLMYREILTRLLEVRNEYGTIVDRRYRVPNPYFNFPYYTYSYVFIRKYAFVRD